MNIFFSVSLLISIFFFIQPHKVEAYIHPSSDQDYFVRPIIIYPKDKANIPEYDQAAISYLDKLQNYYREKTGALFYLDDLHIVRTTVDYQTIRCGHKPSAECLNNPAILDGDPWGVAHSTIFQENLSGPKIVKLVFMPGVGGFAGANIGIVVVGDWVLEPISGQPNPWGIPCKYSEGWQCNGNWALGSPAHELGHALGIPHPDPAIYPNHDQSIMSNTGGFPTVGFLPHEIESLRNSPFFDPVGPAPSSNPSPTPDPIFIPEFNQAEAEIGEIFTISWPNFTEEDRGRLSFINASTPNSTIDFNILAYAPTQGLIYIRINSVNPFSAQGDYLWAQIQHPGGGSRASQKPILIKGMHVDSNLRTFNINFTSWCGPELKGFIHSRLTLFREEDNAPIASARTQTRDREYQGKLSVSSADFQPGQTFYLKAEEFPGISPPKIIAPEGEFENYLPITIPEDNPNNEIFKNLIIGYPQCFAGLPVPTPTPESSFDPEPNITGYTTPYFSPEPNITGDTAFYYYASPTPSPTPEPLPSSTPESQGGLPQPTESPASQQVELTQVMISNYADFRFYNDPDDQGSSTISISNPYDPQNLEWIAKTMGPEKRMYVREIYSDSTYRDFEYPITHNDQRSSVSNIQILIKIVKKVVKIIGDNGLEVRINNPPVNFRLPGTEGQPQQFKIPFAIILSDGSTLHTALTFNYNPPSLPTPTPTPTPCPYQEDPQNCPYGGIRDCTGTQQDGACKYDPAVDPNCRETCNPAPPAGGDDGGGQSCEERHIRNECIACNNSQKVYQRFCAGSEAGDPYAGERQDDSACSSWCASSQPPECDDIRYCDENINRIIHKHGYHDGNDCQYAYDWEEEC